ncbi:hypothetical+protein [Methylocapsa aurea]
MATVFSNSPADLFRHVALILEYGFARKTDVRKPTSKRDLIRPENLHFAVDQLYSAFLSGDAGVDALEGLAQQLNAAGCMFYQRDGGAGVLQLPLSEGLLPCLEEYVRESWYLRDPHASRGWPLVDAGHRVVLAHDIATDDERKKIPLYQELLRDHGLAWWAGIAFEARGESWCLSVLRHADQGAFSRDDARRLALIAPRLGNLISLAQKFGDARASGAMDTLAALRVPALFVDAYGRCMRLNAHAERLLDQDLHVSRGRLRASDLPSDARLQAMLAAACAPGQHVAVPEPVVISRIGRRPLVVEVLPVRSEFAGLFSAAKVLVMITDAARSSEPSETLLGKLFGLTPAEARLATALTRGESLEAASEILGTTRETARTRLKVIFGKTETNRQAELVALLARFARAYP